MIHSNISSDFEKERIKNAQNKLKNHIRQLEDLNNDT